jgi:hypothetical protein
MDLLPQGVEQSVIALWLGHESIETTHGSEITTVKRLQRDDPPPQRKRSGGGYLPAR